MPASTIEGYADGFGDWRGDVVRRLDALVRRAAPGATGSIKWAQPVYEQGGPFAYIKAFSKTVNVGFWRGADLTDPKGLLEGTGDRMRHISLSSADGIDEAQLTALVEEAVELNATEGDPTERR